MVKYLLFLRMLKFSITVSFMEEKKIGAILSEINTFKPVSFLKYVGLFLYAHFSNLVLPCCSIIYKIVLQLAWVELT